MRILMITDDVQIDRRILLEAESLFSQGNEVILLANWAEGLPLHEKIGNVKVERVIAHKSSPLCQLTININRLIIQAINYVSLKIQKIYSFVISSINVFNNIFIKFIGLFLKIIEITFCFICTLIASFVYILYRVFKKPLKILFFKTENIPNSMDRSKYKYDYYSILYSLVTYMYSLFAEEFSIIKTFIIHIINFLFTGVRQATKVIYYFCNITLIKCPAIITNKICQFIHKYASKLSNRSKVLTLKATYFNPDIIHVHDLPQLKAGCLVKRALKIPLIYDAHELYPEIDTLTIKQKKRLKRLESKLIKQCDKVITVNEFIADLMEKRYKVSNVDVIYNATLPIHGQTHKYNLFRENLPIPQNAYILLFQGWMSKTRGIQDLVKSMESVVKDVHLVLMGYGEVQDELREIMTQLNLKDRVHILDAVPQNELLKWTSSADAGIIPYQPIDLNNYYCSPNKLFEFIQAEIPIVANELPFLKKIVQENSFGIVADLNNPDQYAKAINLMFANMNHFNRFKENLKKRSGEFSWEVEEKKLKEIYKSINF